MIPSIFPCRSCILIPRLSILRIYVRTGSFISLCADTWLNKQSTTATRLGVCPVIMTGSREDITCRISGLGFDKLREISQPVREAENDNRHQATRFRQQPVPPHRVNLFSIIGRSASFLRRLTRKPCLLCTCGVAQV